jgi:hypothetical protein
LYFDGCTGFKYLIDEGVVVPFDLEVCRTDEDEEDRPMFVDVDHYVNYAPYVGISKVEVKLPASEYEYVSGLDLLERPEYIISRFPVGYVPIENYTKLVRLTAQPTSRLAQKGTCARFFIYHDVVKLYDDATSGQLAVVQASRRAAVSDREVMVGIASVLSTGTPPVMRRVIAERSALRNSRQHVLDLFENPDRRVAVPSFNVAIVKHRSHSQQGYVLYGGRLIGEVLYSKENGKRDLTYMGRVGNVPSDLRRREKEAHTSVTTRLFADNVVWPK